VPGALVTARLFRFLGELRGHNDRQWFNAHKERYFADVRDPLLAFITAVRPRLHAISPHIVADPRPSGGSLMRVYRDTRFSRDKTPYKSHAALWFPLDADGEAPSYYLHLEPDQVFMGAGMWRPASGTLTAIRTAIVVDAAGWKRATRAGLSHGEASLKRPPRGFDPRHPLIEDLKRTSFTTGARFTETQACSAEFPCLFVSACRRQAPLVKFLAKAMRVPF
jgi:uncharacterized protein (TIGR02453 family)